MELLLIFAFILFIFLLILIRKPSIKLTPETLSEAEEFIEYMESLKKRYISNQDKVFIYNKYQNTNAFISKLSPKTIKKDNVLTYFSTTFSDLDNWIENQNKQFISQELIVAKPLLSNIDQKALDEQQSIAVVTDEDNTLVIAGAGSGKTLTISGKVKYLVERLQVSPSDILLISFTAESAREMTKRIQKKLGIPVSAMTFHKLGLSIITEHEKHRPDISDELSNYLNMYFSNEAIKNKNVMENIIRFYASYLAIPKNLDDFQTIGEYQQDQASHDFETIRSKLAASEMELRENRKTLKLEQVKSLEEVMIANYLYLNGVNYEYESTYPFETDKYRKRYRPDFYLPDYNIYLEHFGINEKNRAPWLTPIEETKYLDGMKWKRELHQTNGTTLIETYSYHVKEGKLFTNLEQQLKHLNVKLQPIDFRKTYTKLIIDQREEQQFKEFKNLIATFINLFKSNGFDENDFKRLIQQASDNSNSFFKERTLSFLNIVQLIYLGYQEELKKQSAIYFNDMINKATEIVETTKPSSLQYKYIIIDEFQDISMGRYRLVKAIKEHTGAKVMAVGDDWQAIYRFAGSDLNLFTRFEQFFGFSKQIRIEKTYRNSQQLIDIASRFVMKNPIQLKKQLRSDKRLDKPIKIYGYVDDVVSAFGKAVDNIVNLVGKNAEIMVIGRNNFDLKFMMQRASSNRFIVTEKRDGISLKDTIHPEVKFQYITVHRSKGLEADNVIVINLRNHLIGFPNKISDDPILSMVLTNADLFIYAEERRLFYVAITRTKQVTYLIAPEKDTSMFVEELIKEQQIPFESVTDEETIRTNPKCDVCQTGVLTVRTNSIDNRTFLGCSNYPSCNTTYKELDILKNPIKCTSCGGYMLKRNGTRGYFYGCSNYPFCRNTMDIKSFVKS